MGRMDEALRRAEEERERRRALSAPPERDAPPALAERPLPLPSQEEAARGATLEPLPLSERPVVEAAPARRAAPRTLSRTDRALAEAPQSRPRTAARVDPRILCYHHPRDRRSEQFRGVRTGIQSTNPMPKTILITSAVDGEGKSILLANLAVSFAEVGNGKVLVVDANLRGPSLAGLLAARDAEGLADRLDGRVESIAACVQPTAIPNVDLIPAGLSRDNPGSLLVPGALKGALEPLLNRYAIILVDSPGVAVVTDAQVLARDVDGVILAVRLENTPKNRATAALHLLEAVDARILGTVVTHRRG